MHNCNETKEGEFIFLTDNNPESCRWSAEIHVRGPGKGNVYWTVSVNGKPVEGPHATKNTRTARKGIKGVLKLNGLWERPDDA